MSERDYHEPARGYTTAILLLSALVAGFVADAALGGAGHWPEWLGAMVIVVGLDLLTIRAARSTRSVDLSAERLAVGDDQIGRDTIREVGVEVPTQRVLGRPLGLGLPRGVRGLTLLLADGTALSVPTRHPDRLARALAIEAELPEIRPVEPEEAGAVAEIEQRANAIFRVTGRATPERGAQPGQVRAELVAGRPPVGVARLADIDGEIRLSALAVLPASMRRGIGAALLEAAAERAAALGYQRMVVTAREDVPWQAPFLRRHGFRSVTTDPGDADGKGDADGEVVLQRPVSPMPDWTDGSRP